ncbi:MAG: O-methyltransferase [Lachnospiraceae bacterium]|nr:O-methyltransferase [Lachnospiraceae bacterium]
MIVDEHISGYLDSLAKDLPESLSRLESEALSTGVPIIRRGMQRLLRFLLLKEKPEAILEIGTAVGFSTLFIYEYAPACAHITTVEKVEMRLKKARKNLEGYERISLIEEDATVALKKMAESGKIYDLVFLDAAKGQYTVWLEPILGLIRPGGILVTDNVLLEGSIARSKFSIERRDRTIHKRMREYLYMVTHDERLETVILPVGDGAAVSVRK